MPNISISIQGNLFAFFDTISNVPGPANTAMGSPEKQAFREIQNITNFGDTNDIDNAGIIRIPNSGINQISIPGARTITIPGEDYESSKGFVRTKIDRRLVRTKDLYTGLRIVFTRPIHLVPAQCRFFPDNELEQTSVYFRECEIRWDSCVSERDDTIGRIIGRFNSVLRIFSVKWKKLSNKGGPQTVVTGPTVISCTTRFVSKFTINDGIIDYEITISANDNQQNDFTKTYTTKKITGVSSEPIQDNVTTAHFESTGATLVLEFQDMTPL